MQIEYLRITITPVTRGTGQLQVDVQTDKQEFHYRREFERDDFTAMFDYLMEEAKHEILELVAEHVDTS